MSRITPSNRISSSSGRSSALGASPMNSSRPSQYLCSADPHSSSEVFRRALHRIEYEQSRMYKTKSWQRIRIPDAHIPKSTHTRVTFKLSEVLCRCVAVEQCGAATQRARAMHLTHIASCGTALLPCPQLAVSCRHPTRVT